MNMPPDLMAGAEGSAGGRRRPPARQAGEVFGRSSGHSGTAEARIAASRTAIRRMPELAMPQRLRPPDGSASFPPSTGPARARPGSRRGARAVEWGGLENRCAGNSTQGSNPCLSATDTSLPVPVPNGCEFPREFSGLRIRVFP